MTDSERRLSQMQGCAAAIMQDSVFRSILTSLKERAIRDWAASPPEKTAERERAYYDLQAVGRLENYLAELVDGRKLAERKEDREAKKNSRDH